MYKVDVK